MLNMLATLAECERELIVGFCMTREPPKQDAWSRGPVLFIGRLLMCVNGASDVPLAPPLDQANRSSAFSGIFR